MIPFAHPYEADPETRSARLDRSRGVPFATLAKVFASRIRKLRRKSERSVRRRESKVCFPLPPLPVVRARCQMENDGAGHGTVTCTVKERGLVRRARICCTLPPALASSSHRLLLPSPPLPSLPFPSFPFPFLPFPSLLFSCPRLSRALLRSLSRDINRTAVRAGHEPRVNRFREAILNIFRCLSCADDLT